VGKQHWGTPMAQFNVFSSIGQSTDNLWPTLGPFGVSQVLTNDISTYWIQLTNGTYVRYSGFFTSYSLNFGVLAPNSGTYSQIDITDVNGNVLATLSNILNADAASILNNPAATVLGGGFNTFTGSTGADTLIGQSGNDQFIVHSGDLVAGDVISGGSGNDTLILAGNGSTISSLITRVAAISSIENLQFQGSFLSTERLVFVLNWNEVDGWANTLNINGRGDPNSADAISVAANINTSADSNLNLSNWTFNGNWGAEDTIAIYGNSGVADFVTGTSQGDTFSGQGGTDVFNGGGGDDTFVIGVTNSAGSSFDGGFGIDTVILNTAAAVDLTNYNLLSVDRLRFTNTSGTVTLNASQFGPSLSTNLNVTSDLTGGAQNVWFNLGSVTSLNLSSVSTTNWEAQDTFTVVGDSDAESITGSNYNDVIISGGGLDLIDAGFGDDIIEMNAAAGSGPASIGSVNGGNGFDTLRIRPVPASFNADYVNFSYQPVSSIQSIEKLEFLTDATHYQVNATFLFSQVGAGLSSNLQVVGAANQQDLLYFGATNTALNLDISGFQFSNWLSSNYIDGNASSNSIVGSTVADIVNGGGGVDSINTGNGTDAVIYDLGNASAVAYSGLVNGGNDTDYLQARFFSAGTVDFRSLNMISMEQLTIADPFFQNLQCTTVLNANQIGGALNTVSSAGTIATLQIEMGPSTLLDLSGLQFSVWDSADKIVINGDADPEVMTGSSQNDAISSGAGLDTLHGGGGNDTLNGGTGSDFVFGDAGQDVIVLNNGILGDFDNINGGTERDLLDMSGLSNGAVWIDFGYNVISGPNMTTGTNLFTAAGDGRVVQMDSMVGTAFNDTLRGDAGSNFIDGGAGDDTMLSYSPYDTVTPYSSLGDVILGGGGNDLLFSGTGNDYLDGGADNDTIEVGAGTDTVVTGTGNDIVFFSPNCGTDTVTDFTGGVGLGDVLKLYGFGTAYDTAAEVKAAASQHGADTWIVLPGTTIILQNFTATTLANDDFVFV
jgi:Ca2+-binding RTX toxin-like protein